MSDKARSSLGLENERIILSELDEVIQKHAVRLQKNPDSIRSSVAYIWKDNERQDVQAWRDFMSANDIGPYGGR